MRASHVEATLSSFLSHSFLHPLISVAHKLAHKSRTKSRTSRAQIGAQVAHKFAHKLHTQARAQVWLRTAVHNYAMNKYTAARLRNEFASKCNCCNPHAACAVVFCNWVGGVCASVFPHCLQVLSNGQLQLHRQHEDCNS